MRKLVGLSFVLLLSGCTIQPQEMPIEANIVWKMCPSVAGGYERVNHDCLITHKSPILAPMSSTSLRALSQLNKNNNIGSTQVLSTSTHQETSCEVITAYFDTGVSHLSKADIQHISVWFKANRHSLKGKSFVVTGYTDNTGARDLNERIALARASSVAKLLTQLGVSSRAITLTSLPDCCRAGELDSDLARQRKVTLVVKE